MNSFLSGKDIRKILFILGLYLFYPAGMIAAGLWAHCVLTFCVYFFVKFILWHHVYGTHMRWIYKKNFLFPLLFLVNPFLMNALGQPSLFIFFILVAALCRIAMSVQKKGYRWLANAIGFTFLWSFYLVFLAWVMSTGDIATSLLLVWIGFAFSIWLNRRYRNMPVRDLVNLAKQKMPLKEWRRRHVTFTRCMAVVLIGAFFVPHSIASFYDRFMVFMAFLWSINGLLHGWKVWKQGSIPPYSFPLFYIMFWVTLGEFVFALDPMAGLCVTLLPLILTVIYICYNDYKSTKSLSDYLNGDFLIHPERYPSPSADPVHPAYPRPPAPPASVSGSSSSSGSRFISAYTFIPLAHSSSGDSSGGGADGGCS